MPEPTERTSVGGFDAGGRALVVVVMTAVGGGLGAALPFVVNWAADLPWIPFQGLLELLGSFDQTWLVWGRPVIGALLGLAFAAYILLDSPVLHIGDDDVQVERRGQIVLVIDRAKVDGVRKERSNIVLQSAEGRELFTGDVEGGVDTVREAFLRHGYPWEGPRE